jgi:hypothetical protein
MIGLSIEYDYQRFCQVLLLYIAFVHWQLQDLWLREIGQILTNV